MRASAIHARVENQIRDAGDLAYQVQKWLTANGFIEFAIRRADFAKARIHGLAGDLAHFIAREFGIEAWKLGQQTLRESGVEKIVYRDVLKGLCVDELIPITVRVAENRAGDLRKGRHGRR